ncbi:N-ethylmaleimide reductase [Prosthecobacter fusiformis]|uniref:N-ethylmaleimide reductase n=1 Tax=Prosthecobacter fusiformis TaxID=48464 RepID=A0A4R7RLL8_9BACT|nr:alkene reductase [Prosthecobacter fusiformis]TDU66214.1 N-ethylmaleimide reductase [Prosthecobacter fusiformis]
MSSLFTPLTLGGIELPNRIFMAPLTRCRADADHVPTDLMVEYYSQRASAGLIIAEATMVMEGNSAFAGREPGIYSDAQIVAWRKVTDAVHAKGGRIFLQLWHGGRACHPYFNDGATPVSASPIPITNDEAHTPEGKKPYATPRELREEELPAIVEAFRKAALNAKVTGFDGVEIHGANGYLLDQFLRDGSNRRGGEYGGPIENRARLLLEVVDAAVSVWGVGFVGVRLSPLNSFNSMEDSDPAGLTAYVATQLDQRGIAYLHLMRADFFGLQKGDVVSIARAAFKGTLIGNMGYTPEEAAAAIEEGTLEGVAFGHHYVSNPDLVERIQAGIPLVEPDASTFYTQEAKGYTDYPTLAAA